MAQRFVVGNLSAPERIVGYYITSRTHQRQNHVEIADIMALVGIDIYHVPRFRRNLRNDIEGIPYMKRDPLSQRAAVEPTADKRLGFVVDLDGVDLVGIRSEPLGQTKRRIARERAELEHSVGAHHSHKHLKNSSLNMSRTHARIKTPQPCIAIQLMQQPWLDRSVGRDIPVEFRVHFSGPPPLRHIPPGRIRR